MTTDEQRVAALVWAAGFRGAADQDEAFDWMFERGYATAEGGLTPEGIERADTVVGIMQTPDPRVRARKRRRTNVVLVALAAVAVWWARRS